MAPVASASSVASMSPFSAKGSPIWTFGRLTSESSSSASLAKVRAVDAVAPGRRAEVEHRVADPRGRGGRHLVEPQNPHAHRVDERVARVARVERDFAPDGGDADAVAVARDPRDDVLEEVAAPRLGQRPEAERVEERDGARPHREDVADDAPDPRGGSLIGLDRARMVVALDLHRDPPAAPDVHDPRVLEPVALQRFLVLAEAGEDGARELVAAVLGPHDGEHPELGVARGAPEELGDPRVLGLVQAHPGIDCGGDLGLGAHGGDYDSGPPSARGRLREPRRLARGRVAGLPPDGPGLARPAPRAQRRGGAPEAGARGRVHARERRPALRGPLDARRGEGRSDGRDDPQPPHRARAGDGAGGRGLLGPREGRRSRVQGRDGAGRGA